MCIFWNIWNESVYFNKASFGKVTIHGLRLRDSRTPGLPDSGTPRLPDSGTPELQDSRTPRLPNSKTPKLQDSRIPTLNPNVKGCVFGELLIFFR